jgi:hypothetical protein
MTVTIFPEYTSEGQSGYRARLEGNEATGQTVGAALDALTSQWGEDEDALSSTLVIVQRFRPDAFFTAAQQERLQTLMVRWRNAQNQGKALSQEEQSELELLVQAEQIGMRERAKAMLESRVK